MEATVIVSGHRLFFARTAKGKRTATAGIELQAGK